MREKAVSVRLQSARRNGACESFDALGTDVGVALTGVTNQWLAARGLGTLPVEFEKCSATEAVETLRLIGGSVSAEQVRRVSQAVAVHEPATLRLVDAAASADDSDDDDDADNDDDSDADEGQPSPPRGGGVVYAAMDNPRTEKA